MNDKKGCTDLEPQITKQNQGDVKLKSYFCPHCHRPLMKGNVKRLRMTCPNCQKMIDSDEKDLFEN